MTALTRRSALAMAAAAMAGSLRPASATDRPSRIAVMELDIGEAMLALGVTPLAMAEAARFRALFPASRLPATVAELGASWEPNLEYLQELAPDRVLASHDREMLVPLLARIAPVTLIEADDGQGRYRRGVDLLRKVGAIIGRAGAADTVVAAAERELGALRHRLAGENLPPVFVVSLVEGGTHLEIYGAGCLLDDALRAIGLRNASPLVMPSYGWVIAGIEHLADRPDAAVIVLDFGAPTRRTLDQLASSPLWRSLPPVAAGRVKRVKAVSVWGGVPTLVDFATGAAKALAAETWNGDAG